MYFDKQQLSENIINITKSPLVYKKENEKGISLFAKKTIKKGTPIIIYYGDIIDKKERLSTPIFPFRYAKFAVLFLEIVKRVNSLINILLFTPLVYLILNCC